MSKPLATEATRWSLRLFVWRVVSQQPKPLASLTLGVLTLVWGVWCLMPWDTYGASPIYGWVGALIPENWGGATCVALSLPLVASAAAPRTSRIAGWGVLLSAAQSAIWWGTITGSCLEGEWRTTATPVYGLFGVLALWLFWSSLWVAYPPSLSQSTHKPAPQVG